MHRLQRFGHSLCTFALALVAAGAVLVSAAPAYGQGVTTSSINGIVLDSSGQALPGATVTATHEPSGTVYTAVSRGDGRFTMANMRVGGPYRVVATLSGFAVGNQEGVVLNLGIAADVAFALQPVTVEGTMVTVEADSPVFSSSRTGAATSISSEAIGTLPTISRGIGAFVRLTPQSSGGLSFAGQDSRYNNITVDGSYFNNSFGLGSAPGDRTGVAPISLNAIEQIQVNVAPYDVRQGAFVGAGVNTVTRSGTNDYSGSFHYIWRDNSLVGTKAGANAHDPGTFDYGNTGFWGGGPVARNKLFFFISFEDDKISAPLTTFRANRGGELVAGNVTRVLASDLDQLAAYLQSNFGYDPGIYEGYPGETPSTRFLLRMDYNLNSNHKVSFRYNLLDSFTDNLVSNSSSLGFGNRRTRSEALNFINSNYQQNENIRSGVGELNSVFGSDKANSLIIGYTTQDEGRGIPPGDFFPLVDILKDGLTYTTFGFEPFTPSNQLEYTTFQFQDNFTWFRERHALTFGASVERYKSRNVFFSGSQSVYVYNSLQDFYTDANGYLANPNRTVSPVSLRRFQVRWMNIPGLDEPVQPLEVSYSGFYAQDEWQAGANLKVVYGLRFDVPVFGETGFENPLADALAFRDEAGGSVQYETAKLPDPQLLWSPRVGFNWDVNGDRTLQVRGGTGIFTGRPAYVWISNQIGTTGVLTGFFSGDNRTDRPFNPDPNHYKPTNVTGAPASSYELALTDEKFKFPQTWRSNIAVDKQLPWGWIGTAEYIYNSDVNGVYYINANLPAASTAFTGADTRPRYAAGNRIHSNISNAIVLKNGAEGTSWNLAFSAERRYRDGFFAKAAYSYGESRNPIDPGSIAFGSWNNNQHPGDPNNPPVSFSGNWPGHRVFVAATYRLEYFDFGATTFSVFWEGRTNGNFSYTLSGDLNGDGGTSNDLIYVPRDTSEMNFQQFASGGVTFTAAAQAQAWEAFIAQDPYLSQHRGEYTERGGVLMPMVYKTDVSITQDVFKNWGGRRHSLQFRADMLNFLNLLNSDWGVGFRAVTTQPLIVPSSSQGGPASANGAAQYRLRTVNNELLKPQTYEPTAGLGDVWRVQFGFRYTFN